MTLKEYMLKQLEEALGDDNRWFCSQHYKQNIEDPEILCRYYLEHGGGVDFFKRYGSKLDRKRAD